MRCLLIWLFHAEIIMNVCTIVKIRASDMREAKEFFFNVAFFYEKNEEFKSQN